MKLVFIGACGECSEDQEELIYSQVLIRTNNCEGLCKCSLIKYERYIPLFAAIDVNKSTSLNIRSDNVPLKMSVKNL